MIHDNFDLLLRSLSLSLPLSFVLKFSALLKAATSWLVESLGAALAMVGVLVATLRAASALK